jgi:hypothetical protein
MHILRTPERMWFTTPFTLTPASAQDFGLFRVEGEPIAIVAIRCGQRLFLNLALNSLRSKREPTISGRKPTPPCAQSRIANALNSVNPIQVSGRHGVMGPFANATRAGMCGSGNRPIQVRIINRLQYCVYVVLCLRVC